MMTEDEFDSMPMEEKKAARRRLGALGQAACDYAEMGWAVLPLLPKTKKPRIQGGCNAATDDWEYVCWWWTNHPDDNIGIATGRLSGGLFVIDVDQDEVRGKYGQDSLDDWEAANGKLPETVCATTGSGGTHLYFRAYSTVRNSVNHTLDIDRRGDGGYVVAPPSVNELGNLYEWDVDPFDNDVAWADETVYDLMAYCDGGEGTGGTGSGDGRFAFPDRVEKGERDNMLYKYAASMRAQGFDYTSIYDELMRVNKANVVPPMDLGDVVRISKSACRKPAGLSPEYQAAKDRSEARKAKEAEQAALEYEASLKSSKVAEKSVTTDERRVADIMAGVAPPIMKLSEMVGKPLPDLRPEIIDGVLRENCKMLVQGASKAGKTWLMIELSVAMATGSKWLGWKCRKGRVLYVNFELQPESFLHRLESVCKGMGVKMADAMRGIDLWNLRGFSKSMEEMNSRHFFPTIKSGEYQLIILDPFYKLMEGSENDAEVVGMFVRHLESLCVAKDVSVAYVHHYSKGSKGDVSPMDRASGSGVFARDADTLIDLAELTVDDESAIPDEMAEAACFRVSPVLRDFPRKEPFDVYFTKELVHVVDDFGDLAQFRIESAQSKAGKASGRVATAKAMGRAEEFCDDVVSAIKSQGQPVELKAIAELHKVRFETARKYVEMDDRLKASKDASRRNIIVVTTV